MEKDIEEKTALHVRMKQECDELLKQLEVNTTKSSE